MTGQQVDQPPPAGGIPRQWLLPGALPLGMGGLLGYQAAYAASQGGFNAITAAFMVYAIALLAGVAVLVGVVNLSRRAGKGRSAARIAFAAAGLLVAGGLGGYAAVPIFDLGYHSPIVLTSRGDASALLDSATFAPRDEGPADCSSVPDDVTVSGVTALDLGELGPGTLRASVSLPSPAGTGAPNVELWIDGADLLEGSIPVQWGGTGSIVDLAGDATSGQVAFNALPLFVDPALGRPPSTWPTALSGSVTWSCGPWFDPLASTAPAVLAAIDLQVTDDDWATADTDGLGTCELETDGSVRVVETPQGGRLQDAPMSLRLDLGGDNRTGAEVHLILSVHLGDPAAFAPGGAVAATSGTGIAWEGFASLTEVGLDERSGRATFVGLPLAGEVSPAGWPAALSGAVSWECG